MALKIFCKIGENTAFFAIFFRNFFANFRKFSGVRGAQPPGPPTLNPPPEFFSCVRHCKAPREEGTLLLHIFINIWNNHIKADFLVLFSHWRSPTTAGRNFMIFSTNLILIEILGEDFSILFNAFAFLFIANNQFAIYN